MFVDDAVRQVLEKTPAQWKLVLHRNDLQVVEDRVHASLFVTLTPSEPGDRISCVAALKGGVICTPEFLLSPPGVAVRLHPALQLIRIIGVSNDCQRKHAQFMHLINHVNTQNKNRWKWVKEGDGDAARNRFLEQARKRAGRH